MRGVKRSRGGGGGGGGRRRAAPLGSLKGGSSNHQVMRALVLLSNSELPKRRKVKPGAQVAKGEARLQVAANFVASCRGYSANNITDAIALVANEAEMQGVYGEFLELLFLIFLELLEEEEAGTPWFLDDDDDYPDMSGGRAGAGAAAAAR